MNHFKNLAKGIFPALRDLDGAGGAGGTGDGTGTGKPEFDAAAFETQMKDFVVKAVNGAVSTHLSRALDNRLTEFGTKLTEGLLGQVKEMLPAPGANVEPGTGAGGDDAIKNATAPLMKKIEELENARKATEARAKQEAEARMQQEEQTALLGALSDASVPGPLAQAAALSLRGNLARDNDGNLHYVAKETGPTGPYEEHVSVAEGVARFLKTDEGKHFLPARSAGGSGNRGGTPPAGGADKTTDHSFVADLLGNIDF